MTTEKKGFDLGDYVQVKDRIRVFYELYGQGRLVTGKVRLTTEPDGKPRVLVQGLAYRTPDDPLPGVGWSWMELPGTTSYTRGSELENTETSAWGRAIGSLGVLIEGSIATTNEIDSKKDDGKVPASRPLKSVRSHDPGKSLIGKAGLGKADSGVDFEVHDGQLAFRLTQGNTGYKVVTSGHLAEQLAAHRDDLMDQRIKVWGTMESEAYTKPHKPTVWYNVVHANRVDCGDLSFPMAPGEGDAPPAYAPTVDELKGQLEYARSEGKALEAASLEREIAEAESAPLFPDEPISDEEAAAILEAELAEATRDELRLERLGDAKDAAGYPG